MRCFYVAGTTTHCPSTKKCPLTEVRLYVSSRRACKNLRLSRAFCLQSNWFLTSHSFYACPSESIHGYLHPLLIFSFFSAAQLSWLNWIQTEGANWPLNQEITWLYFPPTKSV